MMMRILNIAITTFAFILTSGSLTKEALALAEDEKSAVILSYSRIGEDAYPDTNLRIDQFNAHIDELTSGEYHISSLDTIIDSIQAGSPLPDKTVAITFSGAYRSAYQNAMKVLLEREIPFTVFYASDHADGNIQQHLNWKDLKNLEQTGLVNFGLLPGSYIRLSGKNDTEILKQVNRARMRHRAELKQDAVFFSYPFGEYSLQYKNLIKSQGFKAAFGLHSGTIYDGTDMFALPRFSMTENYGSLSRFQMVTGALPLPANDIEPQDPNLKSSLPAIGFTTSSALSESLESLSCFMSGQGAMKTEILGKSRVELRLKEPLSDERVRVNCTIPETDNTGLERWRWLGMLLVNRTSEAITQPEIPTSQQGELQ